MNFDSDAVKWFDENEMGFFSDMLYKCEVLAGFDPMKAYQMYETMKPHQIEHAFTSMTAYNFRHPDDK